MAKPYRKFRSAHKFGKKRKKVRCKQAERLREPSTGVATDHQPAADEAAALNATVGGAAALGATAGCSIDSGESGRQQRTRLDTTFMTPDDRQRLHERAEAITAGLSSVSGTERKLRTLRSSDNTEPSASAPTYTIVDLSAINKLLEFVDQQQKLLPRSILMLLAAFLDVYVCK